MKKVKVKTTKWDTADYLKTDKTPNQNHRNDILLPKSPISCIVLNERGLHAEYQRPGVFNWSALHVHKQNFARARGKVNSIDLTL